MKARVMPDGRVCLPAEVRRRYGLERGGEVIVEDVGDAIVLRTLDQVVARAQQISRKLVGDRADGTLAAFLPERAKEAAAE